MSEPVPIHLVSQAEAEEADFVVCAIAASDFPFTDNVETTCHDCGAAIVHRPHAPVKPPKICVQCVIMRVEAGHA